MKITVDDIFLIPFPNSDIEKLQILFEESSEFFQLINGRFPFKNEARTFITQLPEGKTLSDKFILGIYDGDRLIGIIDIVKNYPEKDTWFIGLFLISPDYRNRGLGQKIYKALQDYFRSEKVKFIKISVAEQNVLALKFWKNLGFIETYSKIDKIDNNEINFIYFESKL
ncbi:MAG: GNAT family N-acetyltransferase [Candidatus Paceibacterota bacterium]